MTPLEMKNTIMDILDDQKAIDTAVLDVKELTDVSDWFVVCTGRSSRHVKAIADKLITRMREEGARPLSVEGSDIGYWVLVDFVDVVIHVMQEEAREFYEIEKLWAASAVNQISDA